MSSSSDRDEKVSSQPDPVAAEVRKDKKTSRGWEFMFFFTEAGLIALYVIFSTYADGQAISSALNEEDYARDNAQATKTMQEVFPMWTDINVMVFVGFGFLKVFLKTNSLTAISFNLLIGAFAMQWGILCYAFWEMLLNQQDWKKVEIDIQHLIVGSQGAAAALISLGALIGKITYV
jgi:ammonium transporter Rh